MKKTMVLFGITTCMMVGCMNTEKKEEAKEPWRIEKKQEVKKEEPKLAQISDEMKLELPVLQFDEILLKNADEMKQEFLKAGMTEKDGSYTYGDITIDSMKEIRDSIYFTLTFKNAVSNIVRYHAFDSLRIQRMGDSHVNRRMEEKEKGKAEKDTGRLPDNLAYVLETNDKMEKYITWTVVEDQNGNTKQVTFRVQKAQI